MSDDETLKQPSASQTAVGNRKIKQKAEQLAQLIVDNKDKEFFVCTHDNPDPDALASGLGVLRILNFLGVESDKIWYCGEIGHPQNRALQVALNVPVKGWTVEVEKAVAAKQDDCFFIFVDVCGPEQTNMSIPYVPRIVVDHHKVTPKSKDVLFVHDEIGACATLVADLMLNMPPLVSDDDEKEWCFDHEVDGMRVLCTALALGIKIDTLDFLSENSADYDYKAYKLCTSYMLAEKFHKVVNYELPPYMFEYERLAFENKVVNSPTCIIGIGFIDESRGDCVPYLADKYMRLQGIQTVTVYAIVGDKVRSSVRNTSAAYDTEQLITDVFGPGTGGTKQGIGGAKVGLGLFSSIVDGNCEEDKAKLWDNVKSVVESRFQKVTSK